jgi:hypothetical protein
MLCYDKQLCTIRPTNYHTSFHFEIEAYTYFGPLASKDHKFYHKPMSTMVHWTTSFWLADLQILICSRLTI